MVNERGMNKNKPLFVCGVVYIIGIRRILEITIFHFDLLLMI